MGRRPSTIDYGDMQAHIRLSGRCLVWCLTRSPWTYWMKMGSMSSKYHPRSTPNPCVLFCRFRDTLRYGYYHAAAPVIFVKRVDP